MCFFWISDLLGPCIEKNLSSVESLRWKIFKLVVRKVPSPVVLRYRFENSDVGPERVILWPCLFAYGYRYILMRLIAKSKYRSLWPKSMFLKVFRYYGHFRSHSMQCALYCHRFVRVTPVTHKKSPSNTGNIVNYCSQRHPGYCQQFRCPVWRGRKGPGSLVPGPRVPGEYVSYVQEGTVRFLVSL